MPRLNHAISYSVFYLYKRDERTGKLLGPKGTGFLVNRQSTEVPPFSHIYAVSNWHVVSRDNASVIRVNTSNMKTREIDLAPHDWIFNRSGDDLAIADITDLINLHTDQCSFIDERNFVSQDILIDFVIGMGDDTVMVGMYVDNPGGTRNVPASRFGNIAMLCDSNAPIKQPNGMVRMAHLVDTRSRAGFSGSPVFVYRSPTSDLRSIWNKVPNVNSGYHFNQNGNILFALLGVHCAQHWETIEVNKAKRKTSQDAGDPILEGDKLRIQGGMTIVIPAWGITELLEHSELAQKRKDRDERLTPEWKKLPRAESVSDDDPPANNFPPME